jgi:cobalt-zinc-cadmium efflux system outer membrane protein
VFPILRERDAGSPPPSRTRGRIRFAVVAAPALASVAAAGCARYVAEPLSVPEYREAWTSRSLEPTLSLFQSSTEPSPATAADGVSLAEAEFAALYLNPEVREARARAGVAQARFNEAGWWEDPSFDGDILRFIDDAEEPWLWGASVAFSIPLSGRLGVEQDLARSEWTAQRWEALASEWKLATELREAWMEWSSALAKRDLAAGSLQEVESVGTVAERLAQEGILSRPEARVFAIERARRTGDLAKAEAEAEEGQLKIKALLGLAPEAPLQFVPSLTLAQGALSTEPAERRQLLEQRHPELLQTLAEYQSAEETLRLEVRKQYPDLEIGPAFEREEGESRLGVGLSVPIPLWNRNRQAIAEAEASREAARAAFEARFERLMGDLARAEASLKTAQASLAHLEGTLAPLVAEQEEEVRRLAQLGSLDTLLLLEALSTGYEIKQQIVEARGEVALAQVRVAALISPPAGASLGAVPLPAPADGEETPFSLMSAAAPAAQEESR